MKVEKMQTRPGQTPCPYPLTNSHQVPPAGFLCQPLHSEYRQLLGLFLNSRVPKIGAISTLASCVPGAPSAWEGDSGLCSCTSMQEVAGVSCLPGVSVSIPVQSPAVILDKRKIYVPQAALISPCCQPFPDPGIFWGRAKSPRVRKGHYKSPQGQMRPREGQMFAPGHQETKVVLG